MRILFLFAQDTLQSGWLGVTAQDGTGTYFADGGGSDYMHGGNADGSSCAVPATCSNSNLDSDPYYPAEEQADCGGVCNDCVCTASSCSNGGVCTDNPGSANGYDLCHRVVVVVLR